MQHSSTARTTMAMVRAAWVYVGVVLGLLMASDSMSLGGTFVAFGPQTFIRATGQPVTVTTLFAIRNPQTTYTLRINNGGLHGELARVSSAVITLNGAQVVGPNEFSQTVAVIEKLVTLLSANTLAVTVRSRPGSGFTLQILGVDGDPPQVTITSPSDGALLNVPQIRVTGTVRDRTSGIAAVTCNGLAASMAGATFFCDLSLSDGDNMIVVQAMDLAGNVGTTRIRVTLGTNQAPVANAGRDFHAETGMPVMLDGSASFDPDRDMLTFSWRFLRLPSGSMVTDASLVGAMTAAPRFTPDVSGDYEVELAVSDGKLSDTDTVVVAATPPNVPPHANAGPDQTTMVGMAVLLNGTDSKDPDNGPAPLSFQWSFAEVPSGSRLTNADISGAQTALASFRPDIVGTYRVLLVVSDGAAADQAEVHVQALPPNVPPNADAGPDVMILLGQVATLDGTGSNDPDHGPGPLVLQWTFVDVPPGSGLTDTALQGAHTPTPSFTPDVPGVYLLRLAVSDGAASAHDQAMVTANDVPVATADAFTVAEDTTLTVPAPGVLANDTDVVGNPLTATLVSSVNHGTLTLHANGAFTYTPSAHFRGSDSFTYRANDGFVDSKVATVTITVQPSAGRDPNSRLTCETRGEPDVKPHRS